MQIRGGGHSSLRLATMRSSRLHLQQALGEPWNRGSWLLVSLVRIRLRGWSNPPRTRLPCHHTWQICTTSSISHNWGSTWQILIMCWSRMMSRCARIWLWELDRWESWILTSSNSKGRKFRLWRSSGMRQPRRWLGRWRTSWGSRILTCLLVSSLFRGRKISRCGECKIRRI